MKCGMCELEYGNSPYACIFDVTKVALTPKMNVDNEVFLLCQQCALDVWYLIRPAGPHVNSTSCCYCMKNCIGKYAFCFEEIKSFTPVSAKEFSTFGRQTVFCDKCAEPARDAIAHMYCWRGGTLSK